MLLIFAVIIVTGITVWFVRRKLHQRRQFTFQPMDRDRESFSVVGRSSGGFKGLNGEASQTEPDEEEEKKVPLEEMTMQTVENPKDEPPPYKSDD